MNNTFIFEYLIPFSQHNHLTCIQNNHFGRRRVNLSQKTSPQLPEKGQEICRI